MQSIDDAVARGIYEVEFSAEQRQRLEAIFPQGVCDYTVDGVGQVAPRGTWLSYGN